MTSIKTPHGNKGGGILFSVRDTTNAHFLFLEIEENNKIGVYSFSGGSLGIPFIMSIIAFCYANSQYCTAKLAQSFTVFVICFKRNSNCFDTISLKSKL